MDHNLQQHSEPEQRLRLGNARRSAVAVAFAAAAMVAVSVSGQDTPSESSGAGPQALKAMEAAIAFARAVAEENTPEYTAALKKALAIANGLAVSEAGTRAIEVPSLLPGPVDLDSRYRRSFTETQQDKKRIWGGERVQPGTYSDTVAITGNGQLCTGTVIGPDAVLTAAHCYCGG